MKKLILLFILINLAASAQEILLDPQFKKKDKHWTLKKKPEFSKVKSKFSKNLFTIQTNHSSESFYLSLLTEIDIQAGETYELSISTLAKGEGELRFSCISRPQLNLYPKKIKVHRFVTIGITQKVNPKGTWENHSFTFTAKELLSREHRSYLSLQFGAFHGKVQIKDVHLTKL
ncbi:hypothetical protein PQO03_01660 [Lentisphaera profundi]|uniref:CBM-cenC domain-containing protein n=1 Tax=Lentisphaera profundi TaxID=1658616 RepID=A0ABY7VX74_9BACT|nr:hypothetical protein [Lentisphaera profundi]WDE96673.1 hypothetical protein PQO03_01660 [Lentisphaera profundi]